MSLQDYIMIKQSNYVTMVYLLNKINQQKLMLLKIVGNKIENRLSKVIIYFIYLLTIEYKFNYNINIVEFVFNYYI